MKRKLITIILMMAAISLTTIPAMALDYTVPGAPTGNFGTATSVEPVTVIGGPITDTDNVDRSKNSQIVPPAPIQTYSSFRPQAENISGDSPPPNISGIPEPMLSPTISASPAYDGYYISPVYEYPYNDFSDYDYTSYSYPETLFTPADEVIQSDGSIGVLSIPGLGLSVKVYEGETTANMARGVAHFSNTSSWDGNVSICGHNRGAAAYFGSIHTLTTGSQITFETLRGTRTYEVSFVGQILETDCSRLKPSSENTLTLITCVRDVPTLRWCIVAKAITP